jgi:NADPH-dependent 2,4-dienoyl-CoA reductase/sulfur reductase-like enzyme
VAAERGHRVTLAERGDQLGGQFRLAGRQPSRSQVTELIGWFGRRLDALGVDVRLGTEMRADDVAAAGVDAVVLATGSRPPGTAFQRALPMVDRMPGSDRADAVSIHDVLDDLVTVGGRVVLVDDVNDWRGLGTAVHLAEQGHAVTIVTSAAVVGGGLFHSAADGPLRQRFAAAGGVMRPATVVLGWDGTAATVRSTLTGDEGRLDADTLVIAETPVADTALAAELTERGIAFEAIGDCVAPRRASLAIYEGRELALRI